MRLLCLVVLLLLGVAAPASAHGGSDHGAPGIASDVRSVVVAARLPDGVALRVLQNGQALLLRNGSDAAVTVVTGSARMTVPAGGRAQWHHDTAHPDPSAVGPDRPVRQWRVALLADGQRYEVVGELRWSPGPSPWPWLAGAALLVAGAAALSRAAAPRQWRAAALATAVGASIAHTAAALATRPAGWALLGDYLPQLACWALGAAAAALLARDRRDGRWLGALAAAGLLLVTASTATPVLWSSTVLVAVPATLDRLLVTVALGLAAGYLLALPLDRPAREAAVPATPRRP